MENRLSIKLTEDGDIDLDNNSLDFIGEYEELMQCVWTILSINKNEWFLDEDLGLAYKDIVGKNVPQEQVKLAIAEAIYQEDRVKQVVVEDYVLDNKTRKVFIKGWFTDLEDNIYDLIDLGGV